MFPDPVISQASVDEYNQKLRAESERIRDFIVLHYVANERTGDPFWDECRRIPVPDSLKQRIELFKDAGRVFKPQDDVFSENSWVQVLMGQGISPQRYHNIADAMSPDQLAQFLLEIENNVSRTVGALPNHGEFVQHLVSIASK
jgi:tryptophan halogenase